MYLYSTYSIIYPQNPILIIKAPMFWGSGVEGSPVFGCSKRFGSGSSVKASGLVAGVWVQTRVFWVKAHRYACSAPMET